MFRYLTVVALMFTLLSTGYTAHAQSNADLQRMINELIAQIQKMQAQSNAGQSGGGGTTVADPSLPTVTLSASRTIINNETNTSPVTLRWNATNASYCNLFQRSGAFDSKELAMSLPTTGTYQFRSVGWKDGDSTPIRIEIICIGVVQNGKDNSANAEVKIYREGSSSNQSAGSAKARSVELFISSPPDAETGRRYFQHYGTYDDAMQNEYEVQIRPASGYVHDCTVAAIYDKKTLRYPVRYRMTVDEENFDHMKTTSVPHEDMYGDLRKLRLSCGTGRGSTITDEVIMSEFDEVDETVATFKAVLNGKTIVTNNNQTRYEASLMCNQTANQYTTYKFGYGDVLKCYWGSMLIQTIDAWKG